MFWSAACAKGCPVRDIWVADATAMNERFGSEEGATGKAPPLERYIRVLEVLASFPGGASAVEIANILRLPRATAHRLLNAMQDARLVELKRSRYFMGDRIRRLIFLSADLQWMDALIRPSLHDLAEKIGDTCYLGKLDGNRVVSVMMESPKSSWRGYVVQGRNFPPHAGAGAKAILAYQPAEVVDEVLGDRLPVLTRFTKTSPDEVRAEYETIRETGFAVCMGEIEEELVGVAVPVKVEGLGVAYSLGMTGPRSRMSQDSIRQTVAHLQALAERIGAAIGKGLLQAEFTGGEASGPA